MLMLIAGLVIFLGLHSSRIFADDFRAGIIASRGENVWKAIYAALSIGGFVLIVYGYGETRLAPITLWNPPVWTRHIAALLTLFAFILLAAAYI
ncbi:MAG: NnrU family protein, partial [Betaproteobacteria bacterium]